MSEKGDKGGVARSAKTTPAGSPVGSIASLVRDVEVRATRSSSPARLPTDLALKVKTQQSRIRSLELLVAAIPTSTEDASMAEVELWTAHLDELHKAFQKDHAYFEATWPAAFIDHEYFSTNMHQTEAQLALQMRLALGRLRHAFSGSLQVPTQPQETRFNSRLPDISLPTFSGDYASWPPFRELFTGLVLDNDRLTNIERLHYLRGCMSGPPAQLLNSLPLVGTSLQPSWELLVSRYENKRLLIQAQLDQLMGISPVTSRSAATLNTLISTVSDANKALKSLGVGENMWDCILVHHVSRHLDRTTRVAWETSLGSSQEYPRIEQLEAFITSHVWALERIESTPAQPASTPKPVVKKTTSAHQGSAQHSSQTAQPRNDSSSSTYPCDCCNASHFIVSCSRFRDLTVTNRKKLAVDKRLCFNCLGRHNARSCRSTQGCNTCSGRHHTMLHDAHPPASQPSTSQPSQPSTSR